MKWFKRILATLLVIIVLFAGIVSVLGTFAKNDLERFESELRAQGKLGEVGKPRSARPEETVFHSGPAEESAISLFIALQAEMHKDGTKTKDWPWYETVDKAASGLFWPEGFSFPEDEEKRLIEVVRDEGELIDRLKTIAEAAPTPMEQIVQLMDLEAQPIDYGIFSGVLAYCDLLRCDAYVSHIQGRPDDALKTCEALIRLEGHIHDFPILIAQFCGSAIGVSTLSFVSSMLPRAKYSDESLESFADALNDLNCAEAFENIIEEELLRSRIYFSSNESGIEAPMLYYGLRGLAMSRVYRSRIFTFLRANDEKEYLWLVSKYVECARLPFYQQHSVKAEIEAKLDKLGWTAPISTTITPIYSSIFTRQSNHEVQIDLAKVAIALERYQKRGRYPDALDALVPEYLSEVPIDQFSGEELVYSSSGGDYLLYSAGENGVDDGESDSGDDIVWR